MQTHDGPISLPPEHAVEEAFVEYLRADPTLEELHVVAASDRDALVPPLHAFVLCESITPVFPMGQTYRARVLVVLAHDIDDTSYAAATAWKALLYKALTNPDRWPPYDTDDGNLTLSGWPIASIELVGDGQRAGSKITLTVAFSLAG